MSPFKPPEPVYRLGSPFRDPIRKGLFSLVSGPMERLLAIDRINQIYLKAAEKQDDRHFTDKVLEVLNISYEVSDEDLKRIPREGPLMVVANHPFGGIEGIILYALLHRVRPDVKLMANFMLEKMPALRDAFIFVDPFGGKNAARVNLKPMKESIRWLRAGHVLGVFPAGEVSHINLRRGVLADPPWSDTVARLVRQVGCPVLPLFFKGSNGLLFNLLGLIHPRLRTAMLPTELVNKHDQRIDIRIGNPIEFAKLERLESDRDFMDYLRMRTYYLQNRPVEGRKPRRVPFPIRVVKPKDSPVAPPLDPDLLEREINALPLDQILVQSGPQWVLQAQADQIPNVLREIGRLREATFRAAGEGTGQALDIDRFDDFYLHLFVWQREKREVVAAYRLGQTDVILPQLGRRGLYTSTLFRYGDRLLRRLGPALEMGRSFVRPEYQRSFSSLLLLWKGIGAYVVQNPRYRILFGPVSVNNEYQSSTRHLLAAFLKHNEFEPELARMVRPRQPLRETLVDRFQARKMRMVVDDLEDVEALIADIESELKSVPILLKQYLRLGGKLLGFNVDPSFADVLDGLILVDLTKTEPKMLERYMTRPGMERFLAFHGIKRPA